MNFEISQEDLKKCKEFSIISSNTQQEIEFGQADTVPRSQQEISRDNLIGKIAEVAFAKMMIKKYEITIDLDFEYYPRGVWDDQDDVYNGWRIDVKGTRQGGQWLLVEWSKLIFRKKQHLLSHFYVMASVGWDRKNDIPTGMVELVGYASLGQLKEGYEKTITLRKDEILPGTKTKLQADNFGRRFVDLEKDWDKMIRYIKNSKVADTSSYDGV